MQTIRLNNGIEMPLLVDFSLTETDMKAIEPLNQKDTGFRDFADPNYLRRILGMFDLK